MNVKSNGKKEQSTADYLEDYSHEVSEVDINRPKKKKKTVR